MFHSRTALGIAAVVASGLAAGAASAQSQVPSLQPPLAPFTAPATTLPDLPGVIPWDVLAQVKTVPDQGGFTPQFADAVLKLDRQQVKLQGFMMPLQASDKQTHFLLTVSPQTCAFCLPAGPEGIVEIKAKTAVKTTLEPLVLSGTMEVLKKDPMGVYYRLTDARPAAAR